MRKTFAARWAHHIGRRPVRYTIASLVVLLAIAAPVSQLRLGIADDSNTPSDATQHRAHELLAEAFGPGFNGPLVVVLDLADIAGAVDRDAAVDRVVTGLHDAQGVAAVLPAMHNASGDTAVVTVLPATGPQDEATSELVSHLREGVLAASPAPAYVTGHTAAMDDLSARISDRLPWFVGAVVLLSFVLLLVVFRSVLVPLKAAIMNLLSIGAAYGGLVAVFQCGWSAELFCIHGQVPINPFVEPPQTKNDPARSQKAPVRRASRSASMATATGRSIGGAECVPGGAPYGATPTSSGRSTSFHQTSGTTASALDATTTATHFQPDDSTNRASSGRKINCPVALAAVSAPVTRPRRCTNHRLATVAASTLAMQPAPRPTTTPQSATRCHAAVI